MASKGREQKLRDDKNSQIPLYLEISSVLPLEFNIRLGLAADKPLDDAHE